MEATDIVESAEALEDTGTLGVWCNSADYWDVYFDLMEQCKAKFDEKGITIPFNQLDVHLDK